MPRHPSLRLLSKEYYASKLFSSKLKKGQAYDELKEVFQIFITDFNIFNDSQNLHNYSFRDATGQELTDSIQILFLELSKLTLTDFNSAKGQTLSKTDFWGTIINNYDNIINTDFSIPGFEEELKMIRQSASEISSDEREWILQLARESSELEENSRQKAALKKGKLDSAVKLIKEFNLPILQVSTTTGIPVEQLKAELN